MRRSISILMLVGALVFAVQPEALAYQTSQSSWSTNDYTGYCGDTKGGYVVAAQLAETSLGSYTSNIDNYWGTNSYNGMKSLQAHYGVSQDGCAGPITWSHIRGSVYYIGPPPGYVATGPNYEINLNSKSTYGPQYYGYAGCWSSFLLGDKVASPVQNGWYYYFNGTLVGINGATQQPFDSPPTCGQA